MIEINLILKYIGIAIFVIFFFGFCIFIHEFGHFLAARWRKLHIVAFSIGFKKAWSFKKNGIDYRLGYLPFGGYVDLPQLESTEVITDHNGNVLPKVKPIDRIIVAFAGPFFNVLFGLFLGTFLWIHGIPSMTPVMNSIKVAYVSHGSPEYDAGLREGDKILKINGSRFNDTWEKVIQQIILTIGDVHLQIKTPSGTVENIKYKPTINPENKVLAEEGLPYPFFKPEIPVVVTVEKGSIAYDGGLRTDDTIISLNDEKISDLSDYAMASYNAKSVNLVVLRKGKKIELNNILTKALDQYKAYRIGVSFDQNSDNLEISDIQRNSPASIAGLKNGDIIIKANGNVPSEENPLQKIISSSNGKSVSLLIKRDGKLINVDVTPILSIPHYIEGVSFEYYNHINPIDQFINVAVMSYQSIRGILSKNSPIKASHMSGPIGMVSVIASAVSQGSVVYGLNIIAIITFSLALLNLLPLPILDGGHIVFGVIELIVGKPIPQKLMQPICTLFIVILITFMVFVSFNDINRLTHFSEHFEKQHQTTTGKNK